MKLVWGIHAVRSLLTHQPQVVVTVSFDKKRNDLKLNELRALATKYGCPCQELPKARLAALTKGARHQGVAASYTGSSDKAYSVPELLQQLQSRPPVFLVVFDRLKDPRNLGACLRAADAMGAQAAISTRHQSAPFSATAGKAASGATIPLLEASSMAHSLTLIKEAGITCLATVSQGGVPIDSIDCTGPVALVFGSEEKGVRPIVQKNCDHLISIPMQSAIESMNVSVACGIACYEVARQRHRQPKT